MVADATTQARAVLERWQRDPAAYCREALGIVDATPLQARLLEAAREPGTVAVGTAHGTGKTHGLACLLLWALGVHERVTVVCSGAKWANVENLYRQVAQLHRGAKLRQPGEVLATSVQVGPARLALGVSPDAPEGASGLHNDRVVVLVDEASGLPDETFEALLSCAVGPRDLVLLCGNPVRPDGRFADLLAGRAPARVRLAASAIEAAEWNEARPVPVPGLATLGWVRERAADWGAESVLYRTRVLGELADIGSGGMFALVDIRKAQARWPDADGPLRAAVDLARLGADTTRVALGRGEDVLELLRLPRGDLMQTCGHLVRLCAARDVDELILDAGGLGAGAVDRLRELRREGKLKATVRPFDFGAAAPRPDEFANARAWAYFTAREWVQRGEGALPQDDELVEELLAVRDTVASDGRLLVEKKEALRRRLGRSPDSADALAMLLAHAWIPPERKRRPGLARPVAIPRAAFDPVSAIRWSDYTV